ncbi:hypothetical protein BB560_006562 [Smittium megazygosporum]|uniref:Uncharacterized protein n=1 Tax=Smittium megazygosporum TaxID=133381 RepID=A0A2T9Y3Y4_9FUNG|nr:hypothetical protein BB560_006562 [Smittium megazygosporum]
MGDSLDDDFYIEKEFDTKSKSKPETRPTTVQGQVEIFNTMLKKSFNGISSLELSEISVKDDSIAVDFVANPEISTIEDVVSKVLESSKSNDGKDKKPEQKNELQM